MAAARFRDSPYSWRPAAAAEPTEQVFSSCRQECIGRQLVTKSPDLGASHEHVAIRYSETHAIRLEAVRACTAAIGRPKDAHLGLLTGFLMNGGGLEIEGSGSPWPLTTRSTFPSRRCCDWIWFRAVRIAVRSPS